MCVLNQVSSAFLIIRYASLSATAAPVSSYTKEVSINVSHAAYAGPWLNSRNRIKKNVSFQSLRYVMATHLPFGFHSRARCGLVWL
jgi:hypothetical protein